MILRLTSLPVVILFFLSLPLYGEENIPALIRINSNSQPDTLGYNFTNRLSNIVYTEIISGHTRLWDSRDKEIQISPAALKEIEAGSNTPFSDLNQVYVYESWQRNKNEITTTTLGFLFFTKNQKQEDVSFGFVEYKDVADALLRENVNANANGNCNMSMAYALHAHYFVFDLMQFGASVFKSKEDGDALKMEYCGMRSFNSMMFPPPRYEKKISYIIEKSISLDDEKAKLSDQLLKNIEAVLKTTDLFQKTGGYRMQNIKTTDIVISKIVVQERWSKDKANIITNTDWVLIYLSDAPLDTLKGNDINQIDLRIYNQTTAEILRSKNFNYIITKINEQVIARSQTFLYQKAFNESPWNALNEYVGKY